MKRGAQDWRDIQALSVHKQLEVHVLNDQMERSEDPVIAVVMETLGRISKRGILGIGVWRRMRDRICNSMILADVCRRMRNAAIKHRGADFLGKWRYAVD